MCFKYLAKKINIFNRDPDNITIIDIFMTYFFFFSFFTIFFIFTYRYYILIQLHINECNKNNNEIICMRSEFDHVIVPYAGVMYGFYQIFFNINNCIAILVNITCCCLFICKNKKQDKNINIEMNEVKLTHIVV